MIDRPGQWRPGRPVLAAAPTRRGPLSFGELIRPHSSSRAPGAGLHTAPFRAAEGSWLRSLAGRGEAHPLLSPERGWEGPGERHQWLGRGQRQASSPRPAPALAFPCLATFSGSHHSSSDSWPWMPFAAWPLLSRPAASPDSSKLWPAVPHTLPLAAMPFPSLQLVQILAFLQTLPTKAPAGRAIWNMSHLLSLHFALTVFTASLGDL